MKLLNFDSCPFCGSTVSLADSSKVYSRSYGPIYLCDAYSQCDARVGCHRGTTNPLGTLANAELRRWRSLAHIKFDWLWESGKMPRKVAYKWLAQKMGLPKSETHIGMFSKEQCKAVIAAVDELFTK